MMGVYLNFLWFVTNFFSIPNLLATFVSPFMRMQEGFSRGFDPEDIAAVIVVNILMRIVGVVMRTVVIAAGLVCLGVVFVGGLVIMALWIFVPFIVIGLFMAGVTTLLAH